jgi:hypothetical protein
MTDRPHRHHVERRGKDAGDLGRDLDAATRQADDNEAQASLALEVGRENPTGVGAGRRRAGRQSSESRRSLSAGQRKALLRRFHPTTPSRRAATGHRSARRLVGCDESVTLGVAEPLDCPCCHETFNTGQVW